MLTYRDAFEELNLCFKLGHHNALTLWRLNLDDGDHTLNDICISATASVDILDRAIRLQPSSSSSLRRQTKYMLMNHDTNKCTQGDILDIQEHIAGMEISPNTCLKFKL